MNSRMLWVSALFAASAAAAFTSTAFSGKQRAVEAGSHAVGTIADQPVADYRGRLLDLAFSTASALPIEPHIKNRSRAQEAVVSTCFELDLPRRGLRYTEGIDNWRRGIGYADFADYCAQHGDTTEVQHYLDLARQVSEQPTGEEGQDWRGERIRAKIARTYLQLGQEQQAAELEEGIAPAERGALEVARATLVAREALDDRIRSIGEVVATAGFEQVRNAMEACVQLFDRFYDDAEARAKLEGVLENAWEKVPSLFRIDLSMELIDCALKHGDRTKALALVESTQRFMDGSEWVPEHQVPMMARLAGFRHRSGDAERARKDADAARALFDAKRDKIVDIYRAETLCPLAEAYRTLGDAASALAVYKRAVEEATVNPNSRPRAEDLSAICCSLAKHEVEPDLELWARLTKVHDGLGEPW